MRPAYFGASKPDLKVRSNRFALLVSGSHDDPNVPGNFDSRQWSRGSVINVIVCLLALRVCGSHV